MSSKKFKAIIKELFIRCRKLNISIVFITQSYFRTPKDVRLNSTQYVLMEIQSKKELQNIAQENSGDIDFKDFLKTYKDYTSEPYSYIIIDTAVLSNNPMRFRKTFLKTAFIKITKFDQIKILDNTIKANKAQYMVHRENAKISAKSSGELDKYEYLTGEDLDYKPDALTQAKFEYSPLGKTLTFGSIKEDKKEGLLKRLANINRANNLSNLRGINTNIYPRDIDYYHLNKDKIDTRRFYEAYNKLESLEEKIFMINEFYKKIKNFKNDDNILSEENNKKTRVLNNTSRVYNNLLKRYKDEYFEKYKQYNEEREKKV